MWGFVGWGGGIWLSLGGGNLGVGCVREIFFGIGLLRYCKMVVKSYIIVESWCRSGKN